MTTAPVPAPPGNPLALILKHPSTAIVVAVAALNGLILYLANLRDQTLPLDIDPMVFGVSIAAAATLALMLQAWQAVHERNTQPVTWSWLSIVGYALGAAAILQPFLEDFAEVTLPLGLGATFWWIVGQVLIGMTSLHRVWQALAPARPGVPIITEPIPEDGGAGEPLEPLTE